MLTTTLAERDRVRLLLGSGYPFLLRAGDELGIGNMYLGVTEFVEERILTLGSAPYRRFRIATIEVEQPDPEIYVPLAPNTYAIVKATYATYALLKADERQLRPTRLRLPGADADRLRPLPGRPARDAHDQRRGPAVPARLTDPDRGARHRRAR